MYAVEMLNVTKIFGHFKANDNITLQVEKGEIHALLGENGAGKSTLMNLLFGFYSLDGGEIKINEQKVEITNPNIANDLKIGMVHQHFKLIKPFTVAQNITLGSEITRNKKIDINATNKKVQNIIDQYDFNLKATTKVEDLTVGEQQKVEILKMLYKEAEILIFDEPTGALTPQETIELLNTIQRLQNKGKTIILITHKLQEIKAIAHRCTVIRRGKSVATVFVNDCTEEKLAELMVGRAVNFDVNKVDKNPTKDILQIENLTMYNSFGSKTLDDVTLNVQYGEILGIAGVDGNGQSEIVEAITGLQQVSSGTINYISNDIKHDITKKSIREIINLGIGHIPQDRHKHGVVLEFSVAENAVLKRYYKSPYAISGRLNKNKFNSYAEKLILENDIRTPHGVKSLTRDLSGGNQQKLIIAREIAEQPDLLIAVQPTRGVDVGAIENIHQSLLKERENDKGIILVSLELDEIMKLSDRIAVMYDGRLMGIVDAKTATQNQIGLMMAGGGTNE